MLAWFSVVLQLAIPPPNAAQQEQMLSLLRKLAPSYTMQDIVYDQRVIHCRRQKIDGPWEPRQEQDTTERLLHDNVEYWRPVWRDGAPLDEAWKHADVGCRDDLLAALARAPLTFRYWERVRGHLSAVFSFAIPQQEMKCRPGGRPEESASTTGFVDVDAAAGQIWRLQSQNTSRGELVASDDEFDQEMVGGTPQIVKVAHIETTASGAAEQRFEWTFYNFRRFQANSSIHY